MIKRQIGVDFGTTTSVMHYVDYDGSGKIIRESYVPFEGADNRSVPTVILPAGENVDKRGRSKKNNEYWGWKAYNKTELHKFICSEFKIGLLSQDEEIKNQSKQLTQKFFQFLYQQYEDTTEAMADQITTYVTYPSQFPDSVRNFLQQAAKDAGFPNVQMLTEAEAAMYYTLNIDTSKKAKVLDQFKGRKINVMLADLGGGTTDIAIYSYDLTGGNDHRLLGFYPKSGEKGFGGAEVDRLLCNFLHDLILTKTGEDVYQTLGEQDLEFGRLRLNQSVKPWKDTTLSTDLGENEAVYTLPVALLFLNIRIDIDRDVLEKDVLHEYLPIFPKLVNGALLAAGLTGEDIDVVMLTGGHSRWYFVTDMLLGKNGTINLPKIKQSNGQRIITFGTNAQMVVARGAAKYGIVETKPVLSKPVLSKPVPPKPVPPKPPIERRAWQDNMEKTAIKFFNSSAGVKTTEKLAEKIGNALQKFLRF